VQSKFYSPDARRAEKVHELFAQIARRYDFLNDVMSAGLHRRWKNRLVELADARPDQKILDLCCGTGDLACRFQAGAGVIGVDFTEEMLKIAKVRAKNARFLQADALALPFRDDIFDVVSVGYGLRNLADLERGLREIHRVLRRGGKFLSLDFGKPESPALRKLYFSYLRTVLPLLGRIYCGDPDTHGYILASLQEFPAQRGTKLLMEKIGFVRCGFEEFCGGAMAINFGEKS
jgi:demethylmenaquinone methyltransferase/2-methoxy-6-polyprenyl-1,4-benzoquinol methylase